MECETQRSQKDEMLYARQLINDMNKGIDKKIKVRRRGQMRDGRRSSVHEEWFGEDGSEKEEEALITRDSKWVRYRDDFVANIKPESGEMGEGWFLEGGRLVVGCLVQ